MKIIGVYGGHDQAVAYVEDGIVKLALEEERLSRVKHHQPPPYAPYHGLEWLADNGHNITEVDRLAFGEPLCNTGDLLVALRTMHLPVRIEPKIRLIEHHTAHVALAYAWSGWDECYALAVDGGGSVSYALAAHCKDGLIHEVARDNMSNLLSIMNPGLWYILATDAIGLKPLHDEGKLQAMACSGDPNRYMPLFRERLSIKPFEVTDSKKSGATRDDGTWAPTRDNIKELIGIDPRDDAVKRDVAAAIQAIFEEMIMTDVQAYVPKGSKLVVSGGSFCNVTINRKLLNWVSEVFVAPAINDGGIAAGAALAIDRIVPYRLDNVYLGYDAGEIPNSVDPREVAKLIANGAFIGLCQGRCEYGPRSLGNRSILGDPTKTDTSTRLNAKLNRSGVMPFAPVILDSEADNVLEPDWHRAEHSAEHMTITFKVNEEWKDRIPAVVHVDGTCRPQVLRREVNPFYYDVLVEFKKPVLFLF